MPVITITGNISVVRLPSTWFFVSLFLVALIIGLGVAIYKVKPKAEEPTGTIIFSERRGGGGDVIIEIKPQSPESSPPDGSVQVIVDGRTEGVGELRGGKVTIPISGGDDLARRISVRYMGSGKYKQKTFTDVTLGESTYSG